MYLLQDSLETKKRRKPVYFGGMTGIGPMYTEKVEEAEEFESKLEALNSPACFHSMCFFEPVEIDSLNRRKK